MNECLGDWFLQNGEIKKCTEFFTPEKYNILIYEVIRVINGTPVFIENHLERLIDSAKLIGFASKINEKQIEAELELLIRTNNMDGNIRLNTYFENLKTTRLYYFVPHYYPEKVYYQKGVKLLSVKEEREIPNAKILHIELRKKIEIILLDKSIYEVALINTNNCITEGSKSNLFFLKNKELYTAPDEYVLKGITRKFVLDIANNLNIPVNYVPINYLILSNFDSAFLTGTSPKVLPVSSIDNFEFKNSNELLHLIIFEYNKLIENYISTKKSFYNGPGNCY